MGCGVSGPTETAPGDCDRRRRVTFVNGVVTDVAMKHSTSESQLLPPRSILMKRSTLTELATTSGADLNRAGSGSGGDAAQHTDSAEDISSSESDNSDSGSESDAEGETDPVERRTGDKDDVTAGGREG